MNLKSLQDTISELVGMPKYHTRTCIAIKGIRSGKFFSIYGSEKTITEEMISVRKGSYVAVDISSSMKEYEIRDWDTLQLIDIVKRERIPAYVLKYLRPVKD